jgi:type IV secretory pathway VirJ component
LNSDRFAERDAAMRELDRAAAQAEATLKAVLQSQPSLELRRRGELLLGKIVADRQTPGKDRLRQLQALEVLEYLATPQAKMVLAVLANGGPNDRMTGEAQAALRRLEKR